MRWRVMAALLLGPVVGGTLQAQSAAVAADSARSGSALPPWTPRRPAVARTLVEITFINIVAAGINTLARDITSPSPSTWWDNLQGGWSWDPNDLRVNHVEHPWAGAAYFNSARANGLSFWGAAPMALTGSVMWELFGEAKPPSINDAITTSLGGVVLGEPLQRISLIILDEESSGLDRLWREVAVFLTNPGLGLNRISRGQSWSRRQNPPGHRPDAIRGGMAFGARRLEWADGRAPLGSALASFTLEYGDPFAPVPRGPFSHFTAGLDLMSSSPDGLGSLSARGLLARFGTPDPASSRVGGVFMDLDYRRDGATEFAEQSFGVGMLSRTGAGDGLRLASDLSLEAVPLMAVRESNPLGRRRYDYGAGVGARALAALEWRGRRILSAGARAYWAPTLNGASTAKAVQIANVDARLPFAGGVSVGASYNLYRQSSTYADRPTERARLASLSLFLATGY